jgi:hypothetical protein
VIGVLIFVDGRGEYKARADSTNDCGDGDRVRERRNEVGVAAEVDKFEGRTEEGGSFFGFGGTLGRGAVGTGFAFGADNKMYRTTGGGFEGNDAAGAKFDIVRVGAEGKESRERGFSRGHD